MKRAVGLWLIVILAGTGRVGGQDTLRYEEAILLALRQNLQIKILENSRTVVQNQTHPGYAGLLPSVSLTGNVTGQEGQEQGEEDPAAFTTGSYTLSSAYTLFDGLGNIYRFQNLRIQDRLAEFETRDLIELTLLEVSRAYYTAALAYQQYQIAQDLIRVSEERFSRAQKRSQIGQLGTINLLSAKVDLASDQVTLVKARYLWENARRQLNILLDRPLDTSYVLSPVIDFPREYDLDTLKREAFTKNAAYLAARTRIREAQARLKITRAAGYPRLSLTASYNLSGLTSGIQLPLKDLSANPSLGLSLNFSLFDGLKKIIDQKNARIQVQNSRLAEELEKKELEGEIQESLESFQNEKLVLKLEGEHLEVARLNFERTRQLFNLGQVTTTQFREAQLNLFQVRTNLMEAGISARLKEIELLYLTGELITR